MKEVSTRAFHVFLRPLAKQNFPLEKMVEGTSLSVPDLKSRGGRLDWAEACTIHHNLRAIYDDDALVATGRLFFKPRALRFMFIIARLLLTPMGFYRWLNTPRQGAGNQLFTCVKPAFRELSPNTCEIELTLPEDHEVCWDFFLLTKGSFVEMPTLFGYTAGDVRIERIAHGARYHVTIPTRRSLFARIWSALAWPFTARAAARELKHANETLVERYEDLAVARDALERQRVVLDTAYKVGQRIWAERNPAATADAIANALVEIAQFSGASVEVANREVKDAIERATAGMATGEAGLKLDLSSRAHLTGSIRVIGDVPEAAMLLDLLAPTVALALENAFSYRSLETYRAGLEKLVDERTIELRDARDTLAGTVDQLRDAQSARQRFFSHISHEIRTPLSLVILAAADIEKRGGAQLDGRSKQSLGSITDAARKLLRLVDELLLLAAGQENKLVMHKAPTDLVVLLGQLHAAWRPAAEHAGLALELRAPAKLTAVVDPVAIERVASNLVSNAVKYTPRDGRIEIELVDEADGVRMSVFDTGVGIDAELASRLFGRFERASTASEKATGTGIGLSLVKQLVEAHGGRVEALARPTGGTEMRVSFPSSVRTDAVAVARAPRLAPRTTQPPMVVSGQVYPARGLSGGTILLAEDDPALADRIAQLLSESYTVVVGLDGQAALDLVKAHQPQMLITDVEMPRMTGLELAPKFRLATGDQLAPIIILSAVTDLGTRVAGLDAGAVDYVSKPCDPRELEARVRSQFRMRDLAVRLHRAEQLSTLGILTSGLAHELRNPANGIVNAMEPMKEMLPENTPKGVLALMEVMDDCAKQIGFLSRQLLGFRGSAALELQPASLPDLVQRAVAMAQRSLTGVEIRTQLSQERSVMCAAPLLVQVLTNLIENGAHAAGRGGWVEVRANLDTDQVVVEVSDSGSGVPLALRERIFEPFFTTKPQGVGTGLGLSVARAIVQRHGGVLEVRDRGVRAAFVIELPDAVAS